MLLEDNTMLPFGIGKDAAIMITGAAGFLGRNLISRLKAEGFENLLLYELDSPEDLLEKYAQQAKFVFHLAGVNRPSEQSEYYTGNGGLTNRLALALSRAGNATPVLFTSTRQVGNGTDYALSKQEAENILADYGKESGARVYIYRLPGVFGKWSRPNYNTVVATFCHNVARGLPIEVRDAGYTFPICYVDDVIEHFMKAMNGENTQSEEDFFTVQPTYEVSLGWLAGTIRSFAKTRETFGIPDLGNALTAKLWATYQSFLPSEARDYTLEMNTDDRGSFTEFLRTQEHGQISVNVAKPGIVKGNHWHSTKNEKFLVVSGKAVIRMRVLGESKVDEYRVDDTEFSVIDIPPGVVHNIENMGEKDLITVMWASEAFSADVPDTYFELV